MFAIGTGRPLRFPNEPLCMMTKSLEDTDCLALAVSGAFEGYASLYNQNRVENAIMVSYKSYFLSQPRSWNTFLHQHSPHPSSITILNVENCYWMPIQLLSNAIVKMVNLEELIIKGTKMSLPHLAPVFGSCKKIIKLDFNFLEKKWEEIQVVVNLDTIIQGFKKLITLKMSTSIEEIRAYVNDPWVLIIRMLTWCRDCKELVIEINCNYVRHLGEGEAPDPAASEVEKLVKSDLFPNLDWMINLKSLALINRMGDFLIIPVEGDTTGLVDSPLLDDLLKHVFNRRRSPGSLERIWIHRFLLDECVFNLWWNAPSDTRPPLKSLYGEDNKIHLVTNIEREERIQGDENYIYSVHYTTPYQRLEHVEHLAQVIFDGSTSVRRPLFLPNLKYVRADFGNSTPRYRRMLDRFLKLHPSLEYVHINILYGDDYVPNFDTKLLSLKVLSLDEIMLSKELMDKLTEICPNIEVLRVTAENGSDFFCSEESTVEIFSSIRFPKLKSLHLYGYFPLNGGALLLPMIQQCPKLRSLHLSGSLNPTNFIPNFNLFLQSAVHLRDLRLTFDFYDGYEFPFLLLKSLLLHCPDLERLCLLDYYGSTMWEDGGNRSAITLPKNSIEPQEMANFLVRFTSKMRRLSAFCLDVCLGDKDLMSNIYSQIAQKVVSKRPSLCFHMGNIPLKVSSSNVPSIHYNELIDPIVYVPLPF